MTIAELEMPSDTHQAASGPLEHDLIPLTHLRVGQNAIVHPNGLDEAVEEEDGAAMLRAMGLTSEARIRLCRLGEPCIIAICCACGGQTRIGLAKGVAGRIMVRIVD